jgi:putative acetyltransferase
VNGPNRRLKLTIAFWRLQLDGTTLGALMGVGMTVTGIETRRATEEDAAAIAVAHIDSIRALGPQFYPPDVVEAWSEGLTPEIYVKAMRGGEAFFIATGRLDGAHVVLGFATHRVDDEQDGASVYVRGRAARLGIGTALLRLAEQHARAHGATSIQIQGSLAGVTFYKANGFEELGRSEAVLMSGKSMACVLMRKQLPAEPPARTVGGAQP